MKGDNDTVYLGSDSCISSYYNNTIGRPKIFKRGEFLIGGSGSLRGLQLMAYSVNIPLIEEGQDPYHYFINVVGPCIRRGFKEQKALYSKDGREYMDTVFLVGFRGNIFYIGRDFCIDHAQDGYHSIGSGSMYALGSLHSTEGLKPKERIGKALDASCKFDRYVEPPHDIIGMKWSGYKEGDRYFFYDSNGDISSDTLINYKEEREEKEE